MPLSTYPASGFDRPAELAGLLGTFWSSTYGAAPELDASMRGLGALYRQAQRDFDEVLASVSYARTPLLHVDEWIPLTVLESAATDPAYAVPRYASESPAAYGSAGRYGVPASLSTFPVPLAPAGGALMICDAIVDTRVCLVAGVDFSVDTAGTAWLAANPFANPLLSPQPVFDPAGVQVDSQLTLWAWRATTDRGLLQQQVGYWLGLDLPSTEAARDLAVALADALVNGTSELTLRRIFAALYDAPVARRDGEVVAAIAYDRGGLFAATDHAVYRGPASATPVVAVGQVLAAGDPITDALAFDSLSAGAVPVGMAAMATGPALLGSSYREGLAWVDAPTPLDASPAPPEA
jgi:hypothetical protein